MATTLSRWALLTLLLLVAAVTVWLVQPLSLLAANVLASVFTAGQAMRELVVITRELHIIGKPANAVVHDYLVQRYQDLELQVGL